MPWVLAGLLVLVIGAMPFWPHSRGWGWNVAGIFGLVWVSGLLVYLADVLT